jgi:hypothetical protein
VPSSMTNATQRGSAAHAAATAGAPPHTLQLLLLDVVRARPASLATAAAEAASLGCWVHGRSCRVTAVLTTTTQEEDSAGVWVRRCVGGCVGVSVGVGVGVVGWLKGASRGVQHPGIGQYTSARLPQSPVAARRCCDSLRALAVVAGATNALGVGVSAAAAARACSIITSSSSTAGCVLCGGAGTRSCEGHPAGHSPRGPAAAGCAHAPASSSLWWWSGGVVAEPASTAPSPAGEGGSVSYACELHSRSLPHFTVHLSVQHHPNITLWLP